jgi:hypothetical protein
MREQKMLNKGLEKEWNPITKYLSCKSRDANILVRNEDKTDLARVLMS